MLVISLIQVIFCLATAWTAWRLLRSRRPSLLALVVLGFIGLDSVGLVFAPHLPLERLPYLENPVFLIRSVSSELYFRQCASHWIFLTIAFLGLAWESTWRRREGRRGIKTPNGWAFFLLVLGILFSARYYFFGPGLAIVEETRLVFSSTAEAVAHRVQGSMESGLGQGAFLASLAAYIFFPLAAALALQKETTLKYPIFLFCFCFSFMDALQTRQKGPLLVALMLYLLLWLANRNVQERELFRWIRKTIVLIVVIGFLGGWVLYIINFGQTPGDAVLAVLYRAFMVPAATETNFFVVFPESIPFRGVTKVLSIPWGRIPVPGEVTIYDVAYAALGVGFSSNASFLAVAWSAQGYLGVFLVSLLFGLTHLWVDRRLRDLSSKLVSVSYGFTIPSIITLVSGAFVTYVIRGGVLAPLAFIVMAALWHLPITARKAPIQEFA